MIKIKTKQVISVQDWDDLVMKTYGKPYMFQQQDGCKERGNFNLTIPGKGEDYENETISEEINGEEMGVSFSSWLARNSKEWNGEKREKRFVNLFWERNFYPNVQMIANDLHTKGLIPAGDYTIEIDW
jgi:hypothetical protein